MAATTSQGTGHGSANKETVTELSILANGPVIMFSGIVESVESLASPPADTNTIVFPYPLAGGMDKYVVLLTTINGGMAYVADRDEDSDGNFTGFTFVAEAECSVMYLVAKVGTKPNVNV
jgi:hypothetical protein